MYNNNTPYNHYLVDWLLVVVNPVDEIVVVGDTAIIHFFRLPVVVNPVDEIEVVGGVVGIHLFSYLW